MPPKIIAMWKSLVINSNFDPSNLGSYAWCRHFEYAIRRELSPNSMRPVVDQGLEPRCIRIGGVTIARRMSNEIVKPVPLAI